MASANYLGKKKKNLQRLAAMLQQRQCFENLSSVFYSSFVWQDTLNIEIQVKC